MDIILTEKQQEIFDTFFNEKDVRWVLSVGGKGSAKSTVSVYILLNLLFNEKYKGSKILIARESLRDLKNTLVKGLTKEIARLRLPENVIEQHEGLQVIKNKLTDTEVYYLSLSSRNDQYRSVLSYEFNVVIIDELDRIEEEAFDEVSQRMRLKHQFIKGLLNLNPVPETHWVYKKFVAKDFPNLKVITSSTYDNYLLKKVNREEFGRKAVEYRFEDRIYYVIGNTRYEIVRREGEDHLIVKEFNVAHSFLVEMEHKNYAFRRVMLEGQWGSYNVEDGIYTDVFSKENLFEGYIPPHSLANLYRLYGGIDFGFRRPAFVLIAEDEWGRLIILDEFLGENISTLNFIEAIRRRMRERFKIDLAEVELYGDIAGSFREQADGVSIIQKIKENYGIIIKTNKVKVMESVFYIRQLLEKTVNGQRVLQVNKHNCPITVAGFLGEFKADEAGRPVKDGYYEHIHDAIRYVIFGIRHRHNNNLRIKTPKY